MAWVWQKLHEPKCRKMERNEKGISQQAENSNREYDPYKEDPGAGAKDDDRVEEAREQEARQREGVSMGAQDRLDGSATAPVIDTGTAGQTTKGSYGIDSSTGHGTYMDRTVDGSADVSAEPVEQPADRHADEWDNEPEDDQRPEA